MILLKKERSYFPMDRSLVGCTQAPSFVRTTESNAVSAREALNILAEGNKRYLLGGMGVNGAGGSR